MAKRSSRRRFLKSVNWGIASASALARDWFSLPLEAAPPSERIRIGHIGVGNQGSNNLRALLQHTVAVCDVDSTRLAKAKDKVEQATKRTCAAYSDYRRLLDDKNIDAVVVTTPDHWHALPTIHACQAGKDVYCEKPLSLTIAEGQAMTAAARANKRIVQTGSQQRSDARFRLACEFARNGKLGTIQKIQASLSGVNFKGPAVPDSAPPKELDYDRWLGPAPARPYNVNRVHYNFRFFWDYSGGQLTNWGAHNIDIAHWAMGMDDSGPIAIEGTARYHKEHWYEVPEYCRLTYRYANGVTLEVGMGLPGGVTIIGSKGTIHVTRKQIEATPADLLSQTLGESAVRLAASDNHYRNWLGCIKSRQAPIASVEIGHRSATACHLGNIAMRLGRPIRWDPETETVVNDSEAQAMISRPYRTPWTLPGQSS